MAIYDTGLQTHMQLFGLLSVDQRDGSEDQYCDLSITGTLMSIPNNASDAEMQIAHETSRYDRTICYQAINGLCPYRNKRGLGRLEVGVEKNDRNFAFLKTFISTFTNTEQQWFYRHPFWPNVAIALQIWLFP